MAAHSTPTEAIKAMQSQHGNEKASLTHARSDSSPINSDSRGEGTRQSEREKPRWVTRDGQEKPRVFSPRIVNCKLTGPPYIPREERRLRRKGHSFDELKTFEDLKYSNGYYAVKALRKSRNSKRQEINLPAKVCRLVPPDLRSRTLELYPILKEHDGHRALFLYLMTTTFRDEDTRDPVLPAGQVARCYGSYARRKQRQNNLRTSCLLWRFKTEVMYVKWSKPNRWRGKARTLEHIDVDETLKRAWEDALSSRVSEDAVDFWTGEQRIEAQERREALKGHSKAQEPPCEDSRRWRDYLNRRDPALFEGAKSRLSQAYERVRHDPDFKGQKREEAFRHLRAIEEQPVPIYGFSGNTVRLTALNPSLQTIDGDLRHLLTKEWIELDLSSAQLAIAGTDWGIPEVIEFLSAGKSIWEDLASFLSLPMKVVKPALKKGLYAAVYGALVDNIPGIITDKAEAEDFQFPEEKAKQFTEHSLVKELLEAREVQLNQIRKQGGKRDCYDRWIDYSGVSKRFPERSVLARLNQAREMWLLEPVLRLAEKQDEGEQAWEVALLQHDGFSIQVHDGQEKQVVQTLKSAVADLAEDRGYPTRLEVEAGNH